MKMGLDVSHDAWRGAYSAFHRWRKALAEAAGGELTSVSPLSEKAHYTYMTESFDTAEQEMGFREIMGHSDCDGDISPEMCVHVAEALEKLLPDITDEHGGGHIEWHGGMRAVTEKFIKGCREAHEHGEPLEFG